MRLVAQMPWEKDLSVNESHFGPGGKFRRKPDVQSWMRTLAHQVNGEAQRGALSYHVRYGKRGLRYELLSPGLVRLPLQVSVDFRYPDNRRRDDHNMHKCIADSVADGLGIDDKDIRISTGSIAVDKANPGFTITVTDGEGTLHQIAGALCETVDYTTIEATKRFLDSVGVSTERLKEWFGKEEG